MLRLVHANRTEALLAALATELAAHRRATGSGPLDEVDLVVPNRNVEAYVKLGLARAHGVAAGLRVHLLRRVSVLLLERAVPGTRVYGRDELFAGLLEAFLDDAFLEEPGLEPVRAYLYSAGRSSDVARTAADLRRFQLAAELARLFDEYALARPDMLASWNRGAPALASTPWASTEAWQRLLWSRLFSPEGRITERGRAAGETWLPFGEALDAAPAASLAPPRGVLVFGFSYVAPIYLRLLAKLAAGTEAFVFTLNPCQEYWEDVSAQEALDPAPLRLWGRPGREYVRALDEVAPQRESEPFVTPEGDTLLARVQRDILERRPAGPDSRRPLAPGDESLRLLSCPSPRREVEIVASEIWRLLRETSATEKPLRMDEIAVILHPRIREEYVPHVRAVFREAHELPYSLLDVGVGKAGRVGEAVELLLRLPESGFTRGDVLSALTHPAIRGHGGAGAADWTKAVASVGIFHGLDKSAHEGTYIHRDVYNWGQGLLRLGLGAFMAGPRSLVNEPFELGGETYLPEEADLGDREDRGRLVLLLRSLLADAATARSLEATASEWARFFEAYVGTYIAPADDDDRRELGRILGALGSLRDLKLGEAKLSFPLAAALARQATAGLEGSAGGAGVVVSTFVPMRALPFRAIFLLGMGEGLFPAADRRSALDLRQAERRRGDVSPREGDLYMFLEALLCARDRLVLSYVSRELRSGEHLEPSSVVQELLFMLEDGYVDAASARALRVEHPLRRFDATYEAPGGPPRSLLDEAERERRARHLGEALRAHVGPAAPLDVDRLARELRPEVYANVADLLSLTRPGPAAAQGAPEDVSLPLAGLIALLENPAQGYAEYRLGLEVDDDDAGLLAENDEPFGLEPRARAQVARSALEAYWLFGTPLRETVTRELDRLLEAGEAPAGVIAERLSHELERGLEKAESSLRAAVGPARVRVLRLGRARESDLFAEPTAPLVLEESGRRITVEGRCAPTWGEHGQIAICNSQDNAKRPRYVRRAFVHRAALVAAGLVPEGAFDVHVLSSDGVLKSVHFGALTQHDARHWLTELARAMTRDQHDYFLPANVVVPYLENVRSGKSTKPLPVLLDEARRAAETDRTRVTLGPLRHPERLPPPPDPEALAAERFGLYVSLAGTSDAPDSGRTA